MKLRKPVWVFLTVIHSAMSDLQDVSQNECLMGANMPGGDLPGMPIAAKSASSCKDSCLQHKNCVLYTFHRQGCSTCQQSGGCCYLKSIETNHSSPQINACACSGYAKLPPDPLVPISRPPSKSKNILYILVDDLRPELSPYGQDYAHTPNFEKLAIGGTVFENAYCNIAVCSPSRMSFLTGRRFQKYRVILYV